MTGVAEAMSAGLPVTDPAAALDRHIWPSAVTRRSWTSPAAAGC
jgi:hypothetical protein